MIVVGIFYEHIIEGAEQSGVTLAKALETARGFGYKGLECDLWRLQEPAAGRADGEVKKLFEEQDLKAISVYNGYDFPHDGAGKCREKYMRHLETAAFFGAEKVLCVPGFFRSEDNRDECMKQTAERLSEMCLAAKGYGITVMLEDYDDINSPCCKTSQLELLLENVPELGFAFDTGNFAYCCENAEEAYERLRSRVIHVHLKDRIRSGGFLRGEKADISGKLMFACPAGSGFIGISGLIERLKSDGYSGDFSVEHFGAYDQMDFMKRSFEAIGELVNSQGIAS